MTEQQTFKRITEVRAAGWLSLTDLAIHCGFSYPKMKEFTGFPDFPAPVQPDGWKTLRWEKERVDAWLRAHQVAA